MHASMVAIFAAGWTTACQLAYPVSDLEGGSAPIEKVEPKACPSDFGPSMVHVHDVDGFDVDFCIDSTEVTNAQYREFLSAVGNDVSGQSADCLWNDSYSTPIGPDDLPVTSVDYCDAKAFCTWAGKRLCGPLVPGKPWLGGDPLQSEWGFVCTNAGTRSWPHGDEATPGACAFQDNAPDGPVAVGSLPSCEGGIPGVFDMTGNVWEWIDLCESQEPRACYFQGGSYSSLHDVWNCGSISGNVQYATASDIGFRCCASPPELRAVIE